MLPMFKASSRSISKDLTIGLILVVLIVSSIALLTSFGISHKKAEAELDAKADEYIAFIKDILILPIWNYDFETIEAVCRTYIQNDFVADINVTDHRGRIHIDLKKKGVQPSIVRDVKLFRHNIPIGTVKIALAHGFLPQFNRQLFWSFTLTILINLAVLLIMTGFILRMALKRPFDRLNLIVDSYSAGKFHSFSQDVPHAELKPLVKTLDEMDRKIQFQVSTIQKAEKKYRSIFENSIEGIYQSTPEGRILSANPAYAQILGYESPEALISTVTDIGSQHWVEPEHRNAFVRMIQQGKTILGFETKLYRKDGKIIWISTNARPVYDSDGKLLHFEGLVQDITRRKKTETQLQRLSTAVEQVADNIFITNDQGHISYVNPAFEKSTGYMLDDLDGQNPDLLGADPREAAYYKQILQVVTRGEVWTGRITNKRKNGELFIVEASASPILNNHGQFLGYVAVNRDVTEKIKHEDQLRQAQKMEAIGTLAGGIAHDFNNILGVIIACSELAMENIPDKHIAKADLEKVLEAGLRAKSLVKQILTFSRQDEIELKPLIISPLIKEAIRFLRATLPATVEVRTSIKTKDSALLANPIQVQQILMNLCANSAQAMEPNGGILDIRLQDEDIDSPIISRFPGLKPGPYINLTINDTGNGISEDIIHRIFDPFFTTKKVDEGTGLGLSIVHGIVKKYGGNIYVKSSAGKGASFQVLLPRLEHPGIQVVPETISELPRGKERILLVEDEVILADILQRIISGLGYQVQAFVSSVKAYNSFKEDPYRYDIALIDHTMPQMSGIELIGKIRQLRPALPVILCSGLDGKFLNMDVDQVKIDRLLTKPLSRADLAFAIRKVIDGPG